jgi:hypothetical protein
MGPDLPLLLVFLAVLVGERISILFCAPFMTTERQMSMGSIADVSFGLA